MRISYLFRLGAAEVYLYRRPSEPPMWRLMRESDLGGHWRSMLLSLGRTRVVISDARPAPRQL